MLSITQLSSHEMDMQYDPYHEARRWFKAHFSSNTTEVPSVLFNSDGDNTILDYSKRFLTELSSPKHLPLIEYEREMVKKALTPQGGTVTWDRARGIFEKYYISADIQPTYRLVVEGRDALLRVIRQLVHEDGLPSINHDYCYASTAAAMPMGGHKSDFLTHVTGRGAQYTHAQIVLPNTRNQRGKIRGIFACSVLDNDDLQPVLTGVREWLKFHFPHMLAGWLNPTEYLYPDITRAIDLNAWFLETDFNSMDQHFSWPIVRDIILPIYGELLPEWEFMPFAAKVEELFTAPLLAGSELWTGLHTLFSGIPPTNDFETLYDVCLYLGAHCHTRSSFDDFERNFKAVGDDVLYSGNEYVVKSVYALVRHETRRNGVVLSEEKTRMQQGSCRFLRQVYYRNLPRYFNEDGQCYMRPAYPLVLAINNCIRPERCHAYVPDELLACFTRLDIGAANFQFENIVQWLYGLIDKSRVNPQQVKVCDQHFTDMQMRDWWYKVYGTTYSLAESPSAKLYQARFNTTFGEND